MQGFTIIEVLVAVALFAVVVLVILAPLTGLFGLTQKSNQQVNATNFAQQAVETIRGQWLATNKYRYDLNCIVGPLVLGGASPTIAVQDEDVQGNPQTNATTFFVGTTANCPTSGTVAAGPPLRSVTVTATVNGTIAKLIVEVARP
jgi:prepilin-type N-terminal cleavage/methylation domain-containing protein